MNYVIDEWLANLAAKTPTPGGGAVAALAAAISAAQLGMVAAYTTGPKWQDRETHMQELSTTLATLRVDALGLVDADAKAFESVGAAYQLPKTTDDEIAARNEIIQTALTLAAEPPCAVATLATSLVEIAADLADSGNPNVISDVAVGASMARAALESAIVNIEINQKSLEDMPAKEKLQSVINTATNAIAEADQVTKTVRAKLQ